MIESLVAWITSISQGNQMIAGALMLSVSGAVGYATTKIPNLLWKFILSQFTTSLTFNNGGWYKAQSFLKVSNYIQQRMNSLGSRSLMMDTELDTKGKEILYVTMGYGIHFFIYNKKLVWMTRSALDSSATDLVKEEIKLTVFGRSHNTFNKLVNDNREVNDPKYLYVNNFENSNWMTVSKCLSKPLDTLALDNKTLKMITKEFDYFFNEEDTYHKLGLPHKLTLLLHGIPGNGKTSLIRSLASTYNLSISILNPNIMCDKEFGAALRTVPANSIIAIEDFDSISSTKSRETNNSTIPPPEDFSFLTLSGILNALDGIASLNGTIIILTTNCIEKIDSAILREGRIDSTIELPLISAKEIKNHFTKLYPTIKMNKWPSLSASNINGIKFKAKSDIKLVQKLLTSYINKEEEPKR